MQLIKALVDYYDRLEQDPYSGIPPIGWQSQKIEWLVILSEDGTPTGLQSTADKKGGEGRSFIVPTAQTGRGQGIRPNILWDEQEYVFGIPKPVKKPNDGEDSEIQKDRRKSIVAKKKKAFAAQVKALASSCDDKGLQAVTDFLYRPDMIKEMEAFGGDWVALVASGKNISFQLEGDDLPVCYRPRVKHAVDTLVSANDADGRCMITGKKMKLARNHNSIKFGDRATGNYLVSFNCDCSMSGNSSPGSKKTSDLQMRMGERTMKAYTNALNHLLAKDSKHKFDMGSYTLLFWADQQGGEQVEKNMGIVINGESRKNNGDELLSLCNSVRSGVFPPPPEGNYHIVVLKPNNGRIAVIFHETMTGEQIHKVFKRYFDDFDIQGLKPTALRQMVKWLALEGKEHKRMDVVTSFARAVFFNEPISSDVVENVLHKCRKEAGTRPKGRKNPIGIDPIAAAILKAYLNNKNKDMEKDMDENSPSIGYQLGRLLAVLENLQLRANGKSTLLAQAYSEASTYPKTAFTTLIERHVHHLGKINGSSCRWYRNLIGEIFVRIDGLCPGLPEKLNQDEQIRFAVGLYNQQQELWKKKAESNPTENQENEETED